MKNSSFLWRTLQVISYIFRFFPKFLFHFLWKCCDFFEGNIGAILRYILISKRLRLCGYKVYIGSNVSIDSIERLSIGNNVSIHHNCTLICLGEVCIGNNVSIAHSSSIISTNHTWDDIALPIKYNPISIGRVIINEDVWIGCGVRVLSNVEIKSRIVIGAGTVVNKSLLDNNSLYCGIPARKIKELAIK